MVSGFPSLVDVFWEAPGGDRRLGDGMGAPEWFGVE
jgi:hypothetical protein